ncbi:MAG: NAD(P)/FAD-dependent oxidoreductase [Methanocellales archaeon]|nr:NAD(P)/FAD-dependent oxidoreductase [Methanocellales archaeon]
MEYDVVVVGAGPAGSMAAKYASKGGVSVLLIEEHQEIGQKACAGLISTRALDECEIGLGKWIKNRIRGSFIYSPDGTCLTIDGKETKAYVIDRKIFDRELAKQAVRAGANLLVKAKATSLKDGKLDILTQGESLEVHPKIIIGADGLSSGIAKWAGLDKAKKVIGGVQIEGLYDVRDKDFVEVFVGSVAPGFFAWAVPLEDGIARIGLCTTAGPLRHLTNMLKSHPIVSRRYRGSHLDLKVGAIPLGPPERTTAEGTILVGDAAAQVKPTSGGGIYTGALCAKIAGEVAAAAVKEGDVSAKRLAEYEKRWRSAIGRELSIGMRIHEVMERLNDSDFNEVIKTLDDPGILGIISQYGDMDYPSTVVKKLILAKPRLLKLSGIFAKALR